jgi:deoxyhypusine synthase
MIGAVDMKHDILKEPIQTIDLNHIHSFSDLLKAFRRTSFQSRTLAQCADTYISMLSDPERPTIFLGLAGAMIPGGMKGIISTLVQNKLVDVIVSTGANMYHDFVEALGEHHYIGSPHANDQVLRDAGIDRIYDTYADEDKFRKFDDIVMRFANKLADASPKPMSSRSFLHLLGNFVNQESNASEAKRQSVIWNCWEHGVPIFVPALNDSSIGLALTQHYINAVAHGKKPLIIDEIQDNYEIFQIKKAASKTGVIYVGGGVPKNYIQQTAYLEDLFGIPDAGHDYGFQITTDTPQWGGLSGCTFQEGLSWGKEKPEGKYITCYCDATIALPIIVKSILERYSQKRQTLDFTFLSS